MKIYIIFTAVVCCLIILLPLVLTGIYANNSDYENTVTTEVTVTENNLLF